MRARVRLRWARLSGTAVCDAGRTEPSWRANGIDYRGKVALFAALSRRPGLHIYVTSKKNSATREIATPTLMHASRIPLVSQEWRCRMALGAQTTRFPWRSFGWDFSLSPRERRGNGKRDHA
jgi:hypothetical protein